MCVYLCVYIQICVYIHIYICVCVCVCVCVCMEVVGICTCLFQIVNDCPIPPCRRIVAAANLTRAVHAEKQFNAAERPRAAWGQCYKTFFFVTFFVLS